VLGLPYAPGVNTDVWVGAFTTLAGAALGGTITFALSRQQMKEARLQRAEEAALERYRRSVDRRFQAYSDFLTRARSFRNAAASYYRRSDQKLTITEMDVLLRSANDASALVFLVVESDETYDACQALVSSLGRALAVASSTGSSSSDDPWSQIRADVGPALRNFQIAARKELGVVGAVIRPWIDTSGDSSSTSAAAASSVDDPPDQVL